MFDSIVLRVNNIQRYPGLLQYLMNESKTKVGEGFARIEPNKEALWFRLQLMQFEIEGEKHITMRGEKLTSSHYYLTWSCPLGKNANYVEFNFSIPKLLYGTNLVQFVQHATENSVLWDAEQAKGFDFNVDATYKRFRKFVRLFFEKQFHFTGSKVDMKDVEVRRFDICWNQVFNSRSDAMEYLSYQKEVKKKFARANKKGRKSWDESVFFSTRDYGAKIYHKGSEYKSKHGEKKHHQEINKKENRKVFDVDALQEFADRILRYEITFRSAYMSKIFRNKVFRRKSESWQKKMKKFRRIRRVESYATSRTLSDEKKKLYWRVWMGEDVPGHKRITKTDKAFYEWWKLMKERRLNFCVDVDEETQALNVGRGHLFLGLEDPKYIDKEHGFARVPYSAKFGRGIIRECFEIFRSFKDQFEIKETAYISTTQKKIHDYNKSVRKFNEYHKNDGTVLKRELNGNKVRQILLLLQHHSVDFLDSHNMVSRTTLWRYEKIFREIGLNMKGGSEVHIPSCPGFEWYHQALNHDNLQKYTKNEIFY